MAATYIKAIHRSGGNAAALKNSSDYIRDGEKTMGGELVRGCFCEPSTAASEFLLSKRVYERKTRRGQGNRDVIAYHIRMSFKPGEVTAEEALSLGYRLGLQWTGNNHQFIVAAHTNTRNPHAHIIFNSVNLDCDGKYQDAKHSALALRRVSDRICGEAGLSVIENPGPSKGNNRAEYLGESKAPSARDRLRDLMDSVVPSCKDFEGFVAALQEAGIEVKTGKQLSFKLPEGKRFMRQDTLGEGYSVPAILEKISGARPIVRREKKPETPAAPKPTLLIDIEERIRRGYGVGFERWASIQNLKAIAKTFMFLEKRGLVQYDLLAEKCASINGDLNGTSSRIHEIDKRLGEIALLEKNIGTYQKTLEVYREYRNSKWSKKFYAAHKNEIDRHKAAKSCFDALKLEKLPGIKRLKAEYAALEAEKKTLYGELKAGREDMIELKTAKQNVDMFFGERPDAEKTRGRGAR